MSNIVDTSTETINAEFDAAAETIGLDEQNTAQQETEQAALEEAQQQAEIEIAKGMIATALRFSIGGLVNVEIAEQTYSDTAEAYAVLIIKYFPGGIFALLDQYKEEISAATATFVLIKVVRDAKRQREEEEAKKTPQQPVAAQNTPDNAPEAAHHGQA